IAGIFKITQLPNYKSQEESTHGKHIKADQRRTQEVQTHGAQEAQSGKAAEAPRLASRIEEAKGQETGSRTGEAVRNSGSHRHSRIPPFEDHEGWGSSPAPMA